jgi:RNA polymerase sigma-70 factor (ECF subfamily)
MDHNKPSFDVIGHLAALRRYARALVRGTAEAEDLVQDALVKAYERKSTFRSGGNLKTWLLSIVHNTHVDRSRADAARRKREAAASQEMELTESAGQEQRVRLSQIRDAFLDLPEEQREALYLVAVEDLSYQQAAETLDVPVGTLMSRISRARAKLRGFEDGQAKRPNLRIVGGDDE